MKIEDIVAGERYWAHFAGELRATPCTCLGVGEELVIAVSHDTGNRVAIEPECFICAQQPRWWEFWKKKTKAVFDVKDREEERSVVFEIPFGKWPNVRDVNVEELRSIQVAATKGWCFAASDLPLIDACISFVIRNAKLLSTVWGRRIMAASKRKTFTERDKKESSIWTTCACGRATTDIERDVGGAPFDATLAILGCDFCEQAHNSHFRKAALTLVAIEERAKIVASLHTDKIAN